MNNITPLLKDNDCGAVHRKCNQRRFWRFLSAKFSEEAPDFLPNFINVCHRRTRGKVRWWWSHWSAKWARRLGCRKKKERRYKHPHQNWRVTTIMKLRITSWLTDSVRLYSKLYEAVVIAYHCKPIAILSQNSIWYMKWPNCNTKPDIKWQRVEWQS